MEVGEGCSISVTLGSYLDQKPPNKIFLPLLLSLRPIVAQNQTIKEALIVESIIFS